MKHKHLVALAFKMCNMATFSFCSLIWKLKLPNLDNSQQFFLQSLAATILLIPCILLFENKSGIINKFKVYSIKTYFLRSITNIVGVFAWLQALKLTGITQATAVNYCTPIIVSFLAVMILKEKVQLNWIAALVIGALGVYILLIFGEGDNTVEKHFSGVLYALIAAIAFACYNLLCKIQTNTSDGPFIQAFYCFAICTLITLPLFLTNFTPLSFHDILWSCIIGLLGIISVASLFLSYRLSEMTKLSPHSYLKLIVVVTTMYIVKHELPSSLTWLAIGIILIGNSCVIFEKQFYKLINIFKVKIPAQVVE